MFTDKHYKSVEINKHTTRLLSDMYNPNSIRTI